MGHKRRALKPQRFAKRRQILAPKANRMILWNIRQAEARLIISNRPQTAVRERRQIANENICRRAKRGAVQEHDGAPFTLLDVTNFSAVNADELVLGSRHVLASFLCN
jgi:hypothetical protein